MVSNFYKAHQPSGIPVHVISAANTPANTGIHTEDQGVLKAMESWAPGATAPRHRDSAPCPGFTALGLGEPVSRGRATPRVCTASGGAAAAASRPLGAIQACGWAGRRKKKYWEPGPWGYNKQFPQVKVRFSNTLTVSKFKVMVTKYDLNVSASTV